MVNKLPTAWTSEQRRVFRHVEKEIKRLNYLLLHPKTVERALTRAEISTIAWNAAWTAAEAVAGQKVELVA